MKDHKFADGIKLVNKLPEAMKKQLADCKKNKQKAPPQFKERIEEVEKAIALLEHVARIHEYKI